MMRGQLAVLGPGAPGSRGPLGRIGVVLPIADTVPGQLPADGRGGPAELLGDLPDRDASGAEVGDPFPVLQRQEPGIQGFSRASSRASAASGPVTPGEVKVITPLV